VCVCVCYFLYVEETKEEELKNKKVDKVGMRARRSSLTLLAIPVQKYKC
jgi:hypothetical protein